MGPFSFNTQAWLLAAFPVRADVSCFFVSVLALTNFTESFSQHQNAVYHHYIFTDRLAVSAIYAIRPSDCTQTSERAIIYRFGTYQGCLQSPSERPLGFASRALYIGKTFSLYVRIFIIYW